uniref:MBD domain-containing protein n=1 Tax=Aegilops tauschii subsp. strangulata TaxID=200361 RepID=A0A453CR58_AEGTS
MVETKREPAGEGLPDGWLKEYRPRKARHGTRARRDKFYIDPTNSYEFRSLKEVHHYLESQDTNDRVVTPNKRKIEDLQVSGNQTQHKGRPVVESLHLWAGGPGLDGHHQSPRVSPKGGWLN